MFTGILTTPLAPQVSALRPQTPQPTGKRLTDDERTVEAGEGAGSVRATNHVEDGDRCKGPVPSSRTGQKRRRERSPLHRLIVLLAKTYRQPGRLPTIEQGAEMERLCAETEEMMEYRRNHPDWRQEGKWF